MSPCLPQEAKVRDWAGHMTPRGPSVEMTTTLQEMPGLRQKTLGPGLARCIFWLSKEAL